MNDILQEFPAYRWFLEDKGEEYLKGFQSGHLKGSQKGFHEGYHVALKEGLRQGILQLGRQMGTLAIQQATINVVVAYFPELEKLARAKIMAFDDSERLQNLILNRDCLNSQEEMERALLSLDLDE